MPVEPWGEYDKAFGHQTPRADERSPQRKARIAAAGREVFAKNFGAPLAALEIQGDSNVRETDVPFRTDLNLLWDAVRKWVDLIEGDRASGDTMPGWRKAKAWRRALKNLQHSNGQVVYRSGPNQQVRGRSVVRAYLTVGHETSDQVRQNLLQLCDQGGCAPCREKLASFQAMLDKLLDLLERRLLNE